MVSTPVRVLVLASLCAECVQGFKDSPYGPFQLKQCETLEQARAQLAAHVFDALLLDTHSIANAPELGILRTATLVVSQDANALTVLAWLQKGAQDVLTPADLQADVLPQRVRAAIERKRIETEVRKSYATDLATGVPHQQQLIEHMSHLLALREREPSAMAVLGLRIDGLAHLQAALGVESVHVLRRKIAVRLRAGVRASDVVAAIGEASFAVLLGSMLAPDDADRVGVKLCNALSEPFTVAGKEVHVALALGIAQYPQDGGQPDALLSRAMGLAASATAQGQAGVGQRDETQARARHAANDD
jgi:diguanylate cyclase (GGDEF)-like protein